MAKRTLQHEINDRAKAALQSLIPACCALAIIAENDYGVDYKGQIFKDTVPAGVEIFIQLKGRIKGGRGKRCKNYLAYPLEVPTLIDCLKKWPLPAFLVVADLDEKAAYYCFLQEYIYQHLADTEWESKESVTIKCPYTNSLSDHERFLAACNDATQFMVAHKIRLEQWRLQHLDPRFSVKISATDSNVNYTCTPIQPVKFEMIFKGLSPEMLDKYLRGYAVPITPETCTIKGAPLFQPRGAGTVRFATDKQIALTLIARDVDGRELIAVSNIKGTRTTSQREWRFESEGPDTEIIHLSLVAEAESGSMNLGFNMRAWSDKPLLRLAHFDDVVKLTDAVVNGAIFAVEGFTDSETVIGRIPEREAFIALQGFLRFLTKARQLARHFCLAPNLPREITREHINDIARLWLLATKGSVTETVNGTLGVTVRKKPPMDFTTVAPTVLTLENYPFSLFDAQVRFKALRQTFEATTVKEVVETEQGHFAVRFAIAKNSKLLVENIDTSTKLLQCSDADVPELPQPIS